jgi:hypothetical protein
VKLNELSEELNFLLDEDDEIELEIELETDRTNAN